MECKLHSGVRGCRAGWEILDILPGPAVDPVGLVKLKRLTRLGALADTGEMIVAGTPVSSRLDTHSPTVQVTP